MKKIASVILSVILLFCLYGCGSDHSQPQQNPDPLIDEDTGTIFDKAKIIDVKIEIDPADWDTLRYEGRELSDNFSDCVVDYEYTYFDVSVTIDGERIEHVGIRKKGYLGSLSALKPSFKINFGTFVEDQTFSGMKRMTLNNDRQDPSHAHQMMSYALFRKAGIAAPRCNLARVTVNGEVLGIYSHVESIKKPFLSRHFDDNDGNLYEGQLADFTPELISKFERKTNEDDPDRSDLDRVMDALDVADSELVAALEQVVDLDSFITFWAMEVIVGHWDGYTGDRNNFYIYCDPTTGLFHFIPWGTDGSFREGHSFLPNIPNSVYAWGRLANRLYACPETRALYKQKITELLNTIWDTETLLDIVDRIEDLASPPAVSLESMRDFLSNRKNMILAEQIGAGPVWPYPFYSVLKECRTPVAISGTFNAIFSDEDSYMPDEAVSLDLTINGELQTFTAIYNMAGMNDDASEEAKSMVGFYAPRPEGYPIFVGLYLPQSLMTAGVVPFHGFETMGVVYEIPGAPAANILIGYIGNGVITFDAANPTNGSEVSGSFSGELSQ